MIYVDQLQSCARRRGWPFDNWCRLTADSLEELRGFAARLNLKREWMVHGAVPYYRITEGNRFQAIRLGALQIDESQAAERMEKATSQVCDWCRASCSGEIKVGDVAVCSENCRKVVEAEKEKTTP
jgi:hypothetical protein